MINLKSYQNRIKKVIIFILGSLFLSSGLAILLYETVGDYLNRLSEEEIKAAVANPFYEINRTLFNIYVIAYILFSQLPEKIRKSKWYLRGLYFTIFYVFCILVYLWI